MTKLYSWREHRADVICCCLIGAAPITFKNCLVNALECISVSERYVVRKIKKKYQLVHVLDRKLPPSYILKNGFLVQRLKHGF